MHRIVVALLIGVATVVAPVHAEFTPEQARVQTLDTPTRHWVWVADISYPNFLPGRAHLVDAAAGRPLGMLTMGYGLSPLGLPRHGKAIYTVETHYDRTARGKRTDVVAVYDPRTLEFRSEIVIPPKKISAVTMMSFAGLTDDDRFLLVYNFTPAQSVTVVDLEAERVAGEIGTAGCGLVFPSGPRSFVMTCGDGSLMKVRLADDGSAAARASAPAIFAPKREFLTEKAVRRGSDWIFVTNHGEIRIVDTSGEAPVLRTTWPLFTDTERGEDWRIGGGQHLAVHTDTGRLYAVVHQGGPDTHKDPGLDVFVYDLATGKRDSQVKLERAASAIQVTQGADPLLLATNAYPAVLDIYDAASGAFLRAVEDVAVTPMLLQTPVTAP